MRRGSISLILGPMFSGKTSELFRRLRREKIAKKETLLIKYAHDTRYSEDQASTHDLFKMECLSALFLKDITVPEGINVIGIDEGQFFPDILHFVEYCTYVRGIDVIVCGLDGNYKRERFGDLIDLVPKCTKLDKLCAVCSYCGAEAPFTKRTVVSEDEVLIGGSDKYVASCITCYFK